MTKEDFEKAISAFDDTEAFLCAAHVDGGLTVAADGSAEAIIVGAVQVIVDKAEHSNDTMSYLLLASSMLHSAMLCELQHKKEEKKRVNELNEKEKAPNAARATQGAEG